jgi:nucleoside-diphosphate-sugar epimerase
MIAIPPANVDALEDLLSQPLPGVVETMRRMRGDLILLGVGGKMGPTLARLAKRASDEAQIRRRVVGVSRFSSPDERARLQAHGVETIRCDLLDEDAVARLPDAPNVVFMTGMKFGATGQEALTWAMNAHLPSVICKKYRRSRIVAFSTGNVYGLTPAVGPGSHESDAPNPVGEYAMSCLGRERIFEHFSRTLGIPLAIVRLNYACEPRYGILVDLALKVQRGEPIDLAMGHFNIIWQGDANTMALRCFDHVATPPFVVNVTGPEILSVRAVALRLGEQLGKAPCFTGMESNTALLSDAQQALTLFGQPWICADVLLDMVANWVAHGGSTLGKPTHFESREGKF